MLLSIYLTPDHLVILSRDSLFCCSYSFYFLLCQLLFEACDGFLCNDGQCISSTRRCDDIIDCITAEDELNCGTTPEPTSFYSESTTSESSTFNPTTLYPESTSLKTLSPRVNARWDVCYDSVNIEFVSLGSQFKGSNWMLLAHRP